MSLMTSPSTAPAEIARSSADARAHCLLCGEWEHVVPYSRRFRWLRRCRGCGLQFADPQPSDSELAAIYDADYYRAFGCLTDAGDAYRKLMRRRADRMLMRAESEFPPSRLLDVGSGLGQLLSVGCERGWHVHGVERNPSAVEPTDTFVHESTTIGAIEEFEARGEVFGLITLLDVIEHLRRPDEVLKQLHSLLRPGGGVVISTVDSSCLPARLMGSRWPHYHRDHLWYFTRPTLTAIVERAGFTVLECGRSWKLFTLQYLLSILAHPEQSPLIRRTAAIGLRMTPGRIARRIFSLPEGLFLIARRNDE